MSMTSSRPYMIRALYEWIVDNQSTPYLLVDAHCDEVQVPQEFVNKDGQIVLNVSPTAVKNLLVTNESLTFNARFGGIPRDIFVPCSAILGIYARENGQGMIFEPETAKPPTPPAPTNGGGSDKAISKNSVKDSKRPSLRIIK